MSKSGAPRTRMSRMAAAASGALASVAMTKAWGSRVWSMIRTERPSGAAQMVR